MEIILREEGGFNNTQWLLRQSAVRTALLLTAFLIYSVDLIISTDNVSFPILLQYTYATSENEEKREEADNGESGDTGNGDNAENNNNNLEEIIEKCLD
jgi:hypothetical protein